MFKALTLYHLPPESQACLFTLEEQLQAVQFAPCAPTQATSIGFVPPRGHQYGALVERFDGALVVKLLIEQRLLPGPVVNERVEEMAEEMQRSTGRKPGSKRRREMKDEAVLDLLPQAFTAKTAVQVFAIPAMGLLGIDSVSAGRLDDVLRVLTRAVPTLAPMPLQTAEAPAKCMRAWLLDGMAPGGFGIGLSTTMRALDALGATVSYSKHSLDGEEIRRHLGAGKQVKQLALNWKDRMDFILTASLQIKGIRLEEGVVLKAGMDEDQDPYDANMLLAFGELRPMLADLLEGLGGRVEPVAMETPAARGPAADAEQDPLYDEAVALVLTENRASISLIQRHLRIGYNRAARILERMDSEGVAA